MRWESHSITGSVLLDKLRNLSEPQAAHFRPVVRLRGLVVIMWVKSLLGKLPGTLLCALAIGTCKPELLPYPKQRPRACWPL